MRPLLGAAHGREESPFPEPPRAGEFHPLGLFEYRVENDTEGRESHREICRDAAGVVFEHAEPIAYRIGSGIRGYSYALGHGGILRMSPITWYNTGAEGKWDLSPGYAKRNLHFDRRIVDACWNCHVGRPTPVPQQPNHYQAPPFAEASIGCERCHGPGGRHVEAERLRSKRETVAIDAVTPESREIVNPSKLTPTQRDSVCNQCHFHGTERILRYGRSDFDFQPGMEFSDIWTVFNKEATGNLPKAVTQTEQMYSSTCWQKSQGRLTCTSCHDPHGKSGTPDEYYRQRCLTCHESGNATCHLPVAERLLQSPGDSCVFCHMPASETRDVPHIAQTDHRVLRKPMAAPRSSGKGKWTRFRGPGSEIPEADVRRAEGLLIARISEQSDNPLITDRGLDLLKPLKYAGENDLPVWEAIGILYAAQSRTEQAQLEWEEILKIQPKNENALLHIAGAGREGNPQKAIEDCQRLRQINPNQLRAVGREIVLLGQTNQLDTGIELAEQVLRNDPGNWQVHRWLAQAYQIQNQSAEAEKHRKLFERLAPPNTPLKGF